MNTVLVSVLAQLKGWRRIAVGCWAHKTHGVIYAGKKDTWWLYDRTGVWPCGLSFDMRRAMWLLEDGTRRSARYKAWLRS